MTRWTRRALLALGAAGLSIGLAGSTAEAVAAEAAEPSAARQMIVLINEARAKHGLAPLAAEPRLSAAAIAHAVDMAKNAFMDHAGSDGSDLVQRLQRVGYDYVAAAENVARGQTTPEAAIRAWLESDGHRRNMLSRDVDQIGTALALGSEAQPGAARRYWALVLGRERRR